MAQRGLLQLITLSDKQRYQYNSSKQTVMLIPGNRKHEAGEVAYSFATSSVRADARTNHGGDSEQHASSQIRYATNTGLPYQSTQQVMQRYAYES